ncbi:nucleoside/nucleotide kinase family protein [Hamadaea tsunoensis]|uniref:uridine kinase n=1 Tax=Hamadaea tsunoensis TaxID=53368 RepID=UPI000422E8B8|nr:uridine kinase [Hamadaea tsunoensis]
MPAARFRPVSPAVLAGELVERIDALAAPWPRIAIDGAPAAGPGTLADALVEPLRVRGRAVLRIGTADFLRPASLRYERGRTDPDSFYDDWLDSGGLLREVLDPLEPGGSGRVLPTLWNTVTDRATRAPYTTLAEGSVVIVDGTLLLGRWLPFDLTVHLHLSASALARRTADEERWRLPAYARYEEEADPQAAADVVVRVDDPRHPAIQL